MLIPLFKPTLKRRDMDSVLSCMVSDRLSPGTYHEQFVNEISHKLHAAGGFALATYHSAISLAFTGLGLAPGDKVIISPLAPGIYLKIIKRKGLIPLLVEVDPHSGLMVHAEIEKALEQEPKALVCHHTLGFIDNLPLLSAYGLPIIEDISQALGGSWQEKPAGSFGTLVVGSLNEENIITAGCGGFILFRKKTDLQNLKKIIENDSENTLLCDLNAAVAIAQLHELNYLLHSRNEIFKLFNEALMRSRHSTLIQPDGGKAVPFSFPVLIDINVKEVRQLAKKKGIMTGLAFNEAIICMDEAIYNSFPKARNIFLKCILFPLYPMLGRTNISQITKLLAALP